MTFLHLYRAGLSDPGYIDAKYKHPMKHGVAPKRELRLLNADHFERNNFFDFDNLDEFLADLPEDNR